jgi:hypothetical protein
MKVPRETGNRLGMDEYTTANRTKKSLVKAKRSLEKLPSQDPWIECRLPKEIESELSLQKE